MPGHASCDAATRYEYEAIVETRLIAHKVLGCKACTLTGKAVQGTFPRHITGAKQYGAGVVGLAVSLLTVGYMSVDRVQKLLQSLRIPISSGAIQDMLTKVSGLVEAPVVRIRQTVAQLPVAHYDETGWRVAGKLKLGALRLQRAMALLHRTGKARPGGHLGHGRAAECQRRGGA